MIGKKHSAFEQAVNYMVSVPLEESAGRPLQNGKNPLQSEERMVTFLKEGKGLMPDSVILSKEEFERLFGAGEKAPEEIEIDDFSFPKSTDCNLFTRFVTWKWTKEFEAKIKFLETFMEESEGQSDFCRLPAKYGERLACFTDAVLTRDSEKIKKYFLLLVGAGRGLTPAADDGMIGVLVGCGAVYMTACGCKGQYSTQEKNNGKMHEKNSGKIQEENCGKIQEESSAEAQFVNILLPLRQALREQKLTTAVSAKYLLCACRGEFSELLLELIQAFHVCEELSANKDLKEGSPSEDNIQNYNPDNLEKILTHIREIGHSSGMDMLYGFYKVLQCISERSELLDKNI